MAVPASSGLPGEWGKSRAAVAEIPMGSILLTAFALMLIIEGILPFLMPVLWRETFRRLIAMSDGQIRFIGLTSMLAGLLLLLFVRH